MCNKRENDYQKFEHTLTSINKNFKLSLILTMYITYIQPLNTSIFFYKTDLGYFSHQTLTNIK